MEVMKLLAVGFIREVTYPEWLVNVVLIKKSNGKWQFYIDYTNLNKACPKDCFSLSRTDQLVDTTTGHEMLSFLDAYSGYNQILLSKSDQAKTAFTTNQGLYYYQIMPFGLKNTGATYQWLMNKMFAPLIRKSMEVYVDNILVKSRRASDHIKDLRDCFNTL